MAKMTDAEKKAWGEKMKKAREAKASKSQVPSETVLNEDIKALRAEIEELKKRDFSHEMSDVRTNARGSLVGTFEKYIVDPANYPDPRERLSKEDRLRRFAFNDNYELEFLIETTTYQTQDGVNTKEPRFTLKLVRIIYDDDTGEKTDKRFVPCQLIFHEDPQAAITIAREQKLDIDESNEKAFLDEMRYIRMRDWLLEAFYPAPVTESAKKRDVVIGNKLVQVYTVSSEKPQSVPFNELDKKL